MNQTKSEQEIRQNKAVKLRKQGINPYPSICNQADLVADVLDNFTKLVKSSGQVILAGRLRSIRLHGGACFAHLEDATSKIQLHIKKDIIGAEEYKLFKNLVNVGDFIEVSGTAFITKKGEQTIEVGKYKILAKAILPLPEKWHGLKDVELRFRKRYLDLLANPKVKEIFVKRSQIIEEMRQFLIKEGFLEVETPILQPIYGGANAKPFTTHHNALDRDFYLRIAPELYLKRLVIGGLEKVFEIGKAFRNEGIDFAHNPEFTILEFYQAYSDYEKLMKFTEKFIVHVIKQVNKNDTVEYDGQNIKFKPPFKRLKFKEAIDAVIQKDIDSLSDAELKKEAKKHCQDVENWWDKGKVMDEIYKEKIRPTLIEPTFLIDHPIELSPLAKKKEDNPKYVERFQLIAGGMELTNAFSELNDPQDQLERFQNQEKQKEAGNEEAQVVDHDFVEALKYGLPPTAGFGLGVDRLVALLTDTHNIKEIILFPTLRPKDQPVKTSKNSVKTDQIKLNIDRNKALELLNSHIKNKNLIKHHLAVEAQMKALASHFKEDLKLWGITGLLHDLDWEQTQNDPEKHSLVAAEILEKEGVNKEIVNAIKVHNFTHGIEPATMLEKTLFCVEELCGLITAAALVRPDKKLAGVTTKSVLKRYKEKAFAKGVNRNIIARCKELLDMELEELVEITLKSMQEISEELGL